MYRIGSIEIVPVVDTRVWVDPGGAFGVTPRVLWARVMPPDARGLVPMDLTCLLVRAGGKTILVETGLGDKLDDKALSFWGIDAPGDLTGRLAALGVATADVDIVVNTHLHADHCGGNTRVQDGEARPTFPNAEYWVQRLEYADARFPNERTRNTYFAPNFAPLEAAGQLRLLDGDTPVAPGVHCVVARGHTRAMQVIVFASEGEYGLFTADLASYAVNFERLAWVTAYDVEPLETIESKRRWQRWALAHDALVIFGHEPHRPAGRLRALENGRLSVEPVAPGGAGQPA
ncbi:MAG: MBL fold metallo-hydrolase [Anaerolineae bacterium]